MQYYILCDNDIAHRWAMGCLMQVFLRKIVMLSRAISWHITGTLWVSVYTKSWWISQWPLGSGGSYSEATSIQEIVIPLSHVMMARLWSQDGIEWFLYGKGKIIHQYTQPKFSKVTSLYLYFNEVDRGYTSFTSFCPSVYIQICYQTCMCSIPFPQMIIINWTYL